MVSRLDPRVSAYTRVLAFHHIRSIVQSGKVGQDSSILRRGVRGKNRDVRVIIDVVANSARMLYSPAEIMIDAIEDTCRSEGPMDLEQFRLCSQTTDANE